MSTSKNAARRAARSALLLIPVAWLSGAQPHTTAAMVRPPVALHLAVESEHYRSFLDDGTRTNLMVAMRDSILPILREEYRFLDWDATVRPPDTVEIHWVDKPPEDIAVTELQFRIRGPQRRMIADSISLVFEMSEVMEQRTEDRAWNVLAVRKAWLALFRQLVVGNTNLQLEVFSRIPLTVQAGIRGGRGLIPARAQDLRAFENANPTFALQAQVRDTVIGSNESGMFSLDPCEKAETIGYTCTLAKFRYPASRREFAGEEVTALLTRARVQPTAVFVVEIPKPENPTDHPRGRS